MMAWMRECGPVFDTVLRVRGASGSARLFKWMLLALALLAIAALMFTRIELWRAVCFGLGMPIGVAGSAVLLHYVTAATRQNRPAHAVLVPRLTLLVRRGAVLLWVAMMLGWALVALAVPHGWLVMLGMNVGVLTLALGRDDHATGIVLFVGEVTLIQFGGVRLRDFMEQPAVLAVAVTLSLLAAWRVLIHVFPARGAALSPQAGTSHTPRTSGGGLNARLRALDMRRSPPAALMLHALGPEQYRYAAFKPVAMGLGSAVLVTLLAPLVWPGHAPVLAHVPGLAGLFCLPLIVFGVAFHYGAAIARSAPEQALYRLTPAAPRAPELNRVLATTLVRTLLVLWAVCTVLLLAGSAWLEMDAIDLWREAALMLATLAWIGWPLRDHARPAGAPGWRGVVLGMAMTLLAGAAVLSVGQWTWWPVSLVVLAGVSTAFIVRRWRQMMAAPPAFPAGRLAVL
ncbi:MAG: hypothetical protein ACLGI6_07215 [Gammaproteobacteria bacterium]